jgi:hypothetical protein
MNFDVEQNRHLPFVSEQLSSQVHPNPNQFHGLYREELAERFEEFRVEAFFFGEASSVELASMCEELIISFSKVGIFGCLFEVAL